MITISEDSLAKALLDIPYSGLYFHPDHVPPEVWILYGRGLLYMHNKTEENLIGFAPVRPPATEPSLVLAVAKELSDYFNNWLKRNKKKP